MLTDIAHYWEIFIYVLFARNATPGFHNLFKSKEVFCISNLISFFKFDLCLTISTIWCCWPQNCLWIVFGSKTFDMKEWVKNYNGGQNIWNRHLLLCNLWLVSPKFYFWDHVLSFSRIFQIFSNFLNSQVSSGSAFCEAALMQCFLY